jgi:DNA-binding ferritin-like protein
MYHKLFQKVYEKLQENIDTLAEGIRTLKEVVPFSLPRIMELSEILDEKQVPDSSMMIDILYADLETIKATAAEVYDHAGAERVYGLQNILADYLQTVEKLCWMVGASMESPEEQAFEDAIGEPETKPIKM